MNTWCKAWDRIRGGKRGGVKQEMHIRLLQAFLKIAFGLDSDALDCYATGVRLGHNRRMPRTQAVFTAKEWRLDYETPENHAEGWVTNYKTAEENLAALREKVK